MEIQDIDKCVYFFNISLTRNYPYVIITRNHYVYIR